MSSDWTSGFREFDWRWQTRQFSPFLPPHPRWDGSVPLGKALLVHTEQCAGDAIQFICFVRQAREQVGKVLLIARLDRSGTGHADFIGRTITSRA